MRFTTVGRLLALMLLLGGILAFPVFDGQVATVLADDDKDESGKDKKDNPGKSEEKKPDKENEEKEKKEKPGEKVEGITVDSSYVVTVTCEPGPDSGTTTCTFTGVVPAGGKKINHLDVPAAAVCAPVLGGEFKEIADDPHTGVTGYQTRGSTDAVTLVLAGDVSIDGSATYWLKAADAIFPVEGDGLTCTDGNGKATFELQTTPRATEAPTTGELMVLIYTCTDVPQDTASFDWFRNCDSEGGVHSLALTRISETAVQPVTTETDASGDGSFADLEPGLYALEMAEGTWCKAMSDNVDADGNVIIEAGQRTTVYGFFCEGPPAS